jgi:NitT/TauT family transport system ATP-binding protein
MTATAVADSAAEQRKDEGGVGIIVDGVEVTYGAGTRRAVRALSPLHIDIKTGSFVSLVGPSGCGKSTLLKVIADLMPPTGGAVRIGNAAPSELRRQGRIGVVFQQANLMPWLTVQRNVELLQRLLRGRGIARSTQSAASLLEAVGLKGFEARYPHQLSGGMQQRASLARALALDPDVLLMDEPFAALDEITRERMSFELQRIWQQYRKTVVFVTHSLAEAVLLSDQVVLMTMRPGRVHKVFQIPLSRPRNESTRLSDDFARLVLQINRELYAVMSEGD